MRARVRPERDRDRDRERGREVCGVCCSCAGGYLSRDGPVHLPRRTCLFPEASLRLSLSLPLSVPRRACLSLSPSFFLPVPRRASPSPDAGLSHDPRLFQRRVVRTWPLTIPYRGRPMHSEVGLSTPPRRAHPCSRCQPHGGLLTCHQKSPCLTQLTYVVKIWSRYPQHSEERHLDFDDLVVKEYHRVLDPLQHVRPRVLRHPLRFNFMRQETGGMRKEGGGWQGGDRRGRGVKVREDDGELRPWYYTDVYSNEIWIRI